MNNRIINGVSALALSAFITLVLIETTLRVFASYFPPSISQVKPHAPDEAKFWRYSRTYGWDIVPSTTGHFSNGFFDGLVTIDSDGIRRN